MLAAFLELVDNPIVKLGGFSFTLVALLTPVVWAGFKRAAFAYQDFKKQYREREKTQNPPLVNSS